MDNRQLKTVIGVKGLRGKSRRQGVKNIIVLSTDKAVYPINAMDMSKALSEKVTVAKSHNLNIMASRGSVIPLFVEQIKSGKPLSITDPNMTRFMMTLDGAVSLVLYAFENGQNGHIFVAFVAKYKVDT